MIWHYHNFVIILFSNMIISYYIYVSYHIIYLDITYLHHNNTQHVSFLLSFTLILLYFFFIWIFIFIPICIISIIIYYYYFYYFPESISWILFFITNIMLFRQSLLNYIIFLSIKLDCSIFYSIHYLRLYTLTIYIYIIFTWITRFVHFIYI